MLLDLNTEQRAAANAVKGAVDVVAGPGSGKTGLMIQRHIEMITTHCISPKDILNLTFTNSAAGEMAARIGTWDSDKAFRTFHSFALDLLQRERENLPFQLCDTIIPVRGEQYQLIKDLMKLYPPITTFNSLKERIEGWQSLNISPEKAIEESYHSKGTDYFYAMGYADYEKKCREQGWLDFHGLITEAVKLLETNEQVRERNKKKYTAVDEFQDTDPAQLRLLELIVGENVFVVGDANQSIYEFRGAHPDVFSHFKRKFKSQTLFLGANYRSTQRLVAFFKKILPVDNGLASHMVSMREEGTDPTFTKFGDDLEEASVVLRCITDPEHSAVIARTNRQLMTFQKKCLNSGIKSKVLGRKNVWEQNEVRELLELTKEKSNDTRPAHEVMTELMQNHNLIYKYRNTGSALEKDPVENLNDIIKLAAKRGTVPEFLGWLRRLTYGAKSDKKPALTLSTVHQMKGRQAKYVFVIGVNQKMMPHADGEFMEEKRIFFVACTRAADELHISFSGNRSEFLNDFVEQVDTYGEPK